MSAAEQFRGAVTSASAPVQGWRGGLERSRARRGEMGAGLDQLILEQSKGPGSGIRAAKESAQLRLCDESSLSPGGRSRRIYPIDPKTCHRR